MELFWTKWPTPKEISAYDFTMGVGLDELVLNNQGNRLQEIVKNDPENGSQEIITKNPENDQDNGLKIW